MKQAIPLHKASSQLFSAKILFWHLLLYNIPKCLLPTSRNRTIRWRPHFIMEITNSDLLLPLGTKKIIYIYIYIILNVILSPSALLWSLYIVVSAKGKKHQLSHVPMTLRYKHPPTTPPTPPAPPNPLPKHTHSLTLLWLEYSWSSSRPYSICPQKNVKMTNSEDLKQSDSNINQVQSIGHFDIRTYKIKQKINKLCFQIYDK